MVITLIKKKKNTKKKLNFLTNLEPSVFIFLCVPSLQLEFLSVGVLSFVTDLGPKGL